MADHFRQLQHAESVSGIPLNWSRAKTIFFISYIQNALTFSGWRGLPSVLRSAARHASRYPGLLNPVDLSMLLARRFFLRQSSLHLR